MRNTEEVKWEKSVLPKGLNIRMGSDYEGPNIILKVVEKNRALREHDEYRFFWNLLC